MPQERVTSEQFRAILQKKASGGSWRGKAAKPTETRGIRFPSKIQAVVYRELTGLQSVADDVTLIIREPVIDLRSMAVAGKPGRWRPDFMVVRHRAAHVEGRDPIDSSTTVEIHEAKGSRASESRDWRLRAAATSNEYPGIPIYVWRWSGKTATRFTLEEALR